MGYEGQDFSDIAAGVSPAFVETLYTRYKADPSSVDAGWRQWFDAMAVDAPHALDGPRYELFSMLAVAATHGMGVALIPPLLIEAELASGELVVACARALRGERAYYLISPAQNQTPVLAAFSRWLQRTAQASPGAVAQAGAVLSDTD